jgi:hypothetical protein
MDIKETGYEDVVWIQLVQDMDQWRAVVNTIMNLLVHNRWGSVLFT